MNLIDFIIGALIANAMPHFILGITKVRYLGLFGYSHKGNIAYGVLQFVIAIILLLINKAKTEEKVVADKNAITEFLIVFWLKFELYRMGRKSNNAVFSRVQEALE